MNKISTGEDSTLKTYRKIAEVIGDRALEFIDNRIRESSKGEDEEVIAAESQMLYLLGSIQNRTESEMEFRKKKSTFSRYDIEIPLDNNIDFLVGLESIIHHNTELLKVTDSSDVSTVIKLDYIFGPDKFGEVTSISYKQGKVSIEFEVLTR